jgi:hypothetical protein
MANIFGPARPTGALGGALTAQKEDRTQRDEELTISLKQAKFFDYLDARESRESARQRQILEDRAAERELPSQTEANIAEDELAEVQADNTKALEPLQQEDRIREIKRRMSRQSIDDIGAVAFAMRESLSRPNANKQAVYKQGRAALLQLAGVEPAQANQFLNSIGILEEYSEESLAAMEMFGNVGLLDIGTSRQEHLLSAEYAMKYKVALAGRKTPDLTTGELKQSTVSIVGDILSGEKWFDDLDGDKDDSGNWTGMKGAVAAAIANRAHASKGLYQKNGIPIGPEDTAGVLMEMMGTMPHLFVTKKTFGDAFNGTPFEEVSKKVIGQLAEAMLSSPTPMTFNETWNRHKREIMYKMEKTYKERANQKSPTLNAPQHGAAAGFNAETRDAVLDAAGQGLDYLNNQFSSLSSGSGSGAGPAATGALNLPTTATDSNANPFGRGDQFEHAAQAGAQRGAADKVALKERWASHKERDAFVRGHRAAMGIKGGLRSPGNAEKIRNYYRNNFDGLDTTDKLMWLKEFGSALPESVRRDAAAKARGHR